MKLQLAGEQDIDEIEALMRRTEQQMENPEWSWRMTVTSSAATSKRRGGR